MTGAPSDDTEDAKISRCAAGSASSQSRAFIAGPAGALSQLRRFIKGPQAFGATHLRRPLTLQHKRLQPRPLLRAPPHPLSAAQPSLSRRLHPESQISHRFAVPVPVPPKKPNVGHHHPSSTLDSIFSTAILYQSNRSRAPRKKSCSRYMYRAEPAKHSISRTASRPSPRYSGIPRCSTTVCVSERATLLKPRKDRTAHANLFPPTSRRRLPFTTACVDRHRPSALVAHWQRCCLLYFRFLCAEESLMCAIVQL
jgi:hypothetical protein